MFYSEHHTGCPKEPHALTRLAPAPGRMRASPAPSARSGCLCHLCPALGRMLAQQEPSQWYQAFTPHLGACLTPLWLPIPSETHLCPSSQDLGPRTPSPRGLQEHPLEVVPLLTSSFLKFSLGFGSSGASCPPGTRDSESFHPENTGDH